MEVEYKNIDPKLIVNEIRNGRSIEAVQKLFGLRFKSEVQDLYMKGLMELGEIPPVDFSRRKKAQHSATAPAIQNKEVPLPAKPIVKAKSQSAVTAPAVVPANEQVDNKKHVRAAKPIQQDISEIKTEKPNKPVVIRKREKKPTILIKTSNFRTIGQSGSITLNKALLIEQLKFAIGDTFEIYREDDRIILQKVDNPPI